MLYRKTPWQGEQVLLLSMEQSALHHTNARDVYAMNRHPGYHPQTCPLELDSWKDSSELYEKQISRQMAS